MEDQEPEEQLSEEDLPEDLQYEEEEEEEVEAAYPIVEEVVENNESEDVNEVEEDRVKSSATTRDSGISDLSSKDVDTKQV